LSVEQNKLDAATDKLIQEAGAAENSLSRRTLLSIAKLTSIAAGKNPENELDLIKENEFLLDYQV